MLLEVASAHALCEDGTPRRTINHVLLDQLSAIWLVPQAQRSTDTEPVSQWD